MTSQFVNVFKPDNRQSQQAARGRMKGCDAKYITLVAPKLSCNALTWMFSQLQHAAPEQKYNDVQYIDLMCRLQASKIKMDGTDG